MSKEFGSLYADSYDTLYHDKDYSGECDLIETLFKQYSRSSVRTVLDLGCGTGNHAVPLTERGYKVVGVDRSTQMLAQAQQKAEKTTSSGNLTLECGDIRTLNLAETFDAVLIMFAVLGYQTTNEDVLSALTTARKHLKKDGLLIFDVWYGPAVLASRPSQRVKVVRTDQTQIIRVSSGELDTAHHLCRVDYMLWRLEEDRLVSHVEEAHLMRYFFPLELELFLQSTKFSPVHLGAFPDVTAKADETTWNVLQAATAT